MNVRVLQTASRGASAVALLELELIPTAAPLWVLVIYLPPDSRGRAQHWTRTETEQAAAFELYDHALSEHIAPAAE